MILALFLAAVAVLLARPARADSAADLLAQVKAQTLAAKAETEKAKAQAKADADQAKKVADETRASCSELIGAVEELVKSEADAKKAQVQAKEAQADAAKLADAARVRMMEEPPPMEERRNRSRVEDMATTPEDPSVTRARVVGVCKAILAKQAPVAAPAASSAPAASRMGWRRPF